MATNDVLDGVRDHYRATGLSGRLKTALTAPGPEDQRLTRQQLAALDQIHTRGLAATAELAELAGITADMSVPDVGSGVGGPALFRTLTWRDDTKAVKTWIAQLWASGPPPSPNLSTVMEPDFAQLSANLGRNPIEGRLGIVTAVFEAA